jgi:hypothetical protein
MIPNAIALFAGEAAMALPTIPTQDKTKRIVVNGWPGTRKVTVSDPIRHRRKMNSDAAVIAKKMKSTVTSKFKI